MANVPSHNGQLSRDPSLGNEASPDLYELAKQHQIGEEKRQKEARERQVKLVILLILSCIVLGFIGLIWLGNYLLRSHTTPPPVITTSTRTLPNGVKFQVREVNERSWDRTLYTYTFTHNGKAIYSTVENIGESAPIPVHIGQSEGVSYFSQRSMICICTLNAKRLPRWSACDMEQPLLHFWWPKKSEINKLSADKKRSIMEASRQSFEIAKFQVRKGMWTVTVCNRSVSDGKFPRYLYIDSPDSGDSWKLRETFTK